MNEKIETAVVSNALLEVYTGIFLIDLKKDTYKIIKADTAIHLMLKSIFSAQEAIVSAIRQTVQPEQLAEMLAFVNLQTLPQRMKEERSIDKDYRGVISGWVRGCFIETERDAAGQLTKILYAYQLIDETRRTQLEQQKRIELEAEMAAVKTNYQSCDAGMWSMEFDEKGQLRFCRWSPEARKMLGFSAKVDSVDTIESFSDRIHPQDQERILSAFYNALHDVTGTTTYDVECRVKMKNEQYHWFRLYGHVTRQEDGTPISFDGFIVNIDEKHTTYELLCKVLKEAEEAKNKALLENEIISSVSRMYFAIFRIDLVHDFYEEVSSDTTVHVLTGHSGKAQEKMNELCSNLVSPEYRDMVMQFFDLSSVADRLAETDTIELEYYAVDGNWHEARFIEKKRDENQRVTHILYVTRIVSKRKQRELEQERLKISCKIAEQANKAKTAFLFNMSHDIRTPMNAILGYAQLIKRDFNKPEKILHYQEKMQQASEFLLSLINNVLDMARIESGKMEVDNEYIDINENFNEIIGVFEAAAKQKNIKFEVSSDIKTQHIMSDTVKVKQIYSNLISNAIKYTPAGGMVRVAIKEYPSDEKDTIYIKHVFEDTGIGMSKEFLPSLFTAFERERNNETEKIMGTGLGMPIVKELVDMLGGTIEVQSELGKGTRFTVMLPHKVGEEGYIRTIKQQARIIEDHTDTLAGKHILLAEDNELNAEIAIEVLESMGLTVDRAADGIICVNMLEKAASDYYDLILMDIQMPNMDGYKATSVIRRLPDKSKAFIPIIAMTANAFDEDKRHALQIGMDGHIAKPLQLDVLKYTLGVVLTRTKIEDENAYFWSNRFVNCDAIKEFERRHRVLGNLCGWLIYEAYGDEKIRYADETLIHMFGCSDFEDFKQYVGGSFTQMVHKEDIDRVENEIFEQISTSDDCIDRVAYRIIRKDGAVRLIDDIGNKAFLENGIPVFYVGLVDVTDNMNEEHEKGMN